MLMSAAENASESHRSMLAAAGANSTLRRHTGVPPPRKPLSAKAVQQQRINRAVEDAKKRKRAAIKARHLEYERIQHISAARPPNEFNEIEFRKKITGLLVCSSCCLGVGWL
jgi:hypothetical protein